MGASLDAAFNVVHDYPGGAVSLAPRMGKGVSTLTNEVKAEGSAKLGLEDAVKVSLITSDLRSLEAFARVCGQMLVPLPDVHLPGGADACMLKLAESTQEFGRFCAEVAGDLADGQISDNELKRIDKEMGLLIATVHGLRESLAVRNEAGKLARMTQGGV